MEDLISRIVNNVGIDESLAKSAISIILNFLAKDGPSDLVAQVTEAMPGAKELMDEGSEQDNGGLLGGLMGGMGAMGALNQLTSAGLDMSQVQGVTKEVVGYAKEKAGEDIVDEVINAIPGLGQFV